MKIALGWLCEHLELPAALTPEQIADQLTLLGLEVEALTRYEQVPGSLAGVVVGRVLTCGPHPNADRLRVTTVDVGSGTPLHIVCGAPNVAAGQTVAVALVGTKLHPFGGKEPITLQATKIRGEASEGMICAEDELGLGPSHDGIWVLPDTYLPGTPLATYLSLHTDWVYEIGVTPNRTDALSHRGVARDLAASLSLDLKPLPTYPVPQALPPCPIQVTIEAPARCHRYTGQVLEGLQVSSSPDWLQQRLLSIGSQPRNVVVDVTNYVLHDIGQPLHAFDLSAIVGDHIVVRTYPTGTPFTTLFDQVLALEATDLVIADAEKPLCLAGVLGGKNSGVTEATTAIFLEAAWFDAVSVRQTKRRHGLHTESAYRFERGVDPEQVPQALAYAAGLLQSVVGGRLSQPLDHLRAPIVWAEVTFDCQRARRLMGKDIADGELLDIFRRLDIQATPTDQPGTYRLRVPPYRHDVTRFEDVVEDVLRIYGYNHVPDAPRINASITYAPATEPGAWREAVASYLAAGGLYECVTNSLVAAADVDTSHAIAMANPLSEANAWLRTSLLPSLLEVAAHNLHRQQPTVRIFEFGKVYGHTGLGYTEQMQLALLLCGTEAPEQWQTPEQPAGYFELKGAVTELLQRLPLTKAPEWQPLAGDPELVYGEAGTVAAPGATFQLGRVRPEVAERYGVRVPVVYARLAWEALEAQLNTQPLTFRPLAQFPHVRRDLSLTVPAGVGYQAIEAAARAGSELVTAVRLFDVFEKEGVRSYALALTLQDPQATLTDKQVEKAVAGVLRRLEPLGVVLRG